MADAGTRALVRDLMGEVLAGAAACGHPIPERFADTMLADTARMKPYDTSMKLDHRAGRPLEIDAIYTAPLAAAAEAGVTLPRIEVLAQQLRFLDRPPAGR
jgi:2-dehydropantoate 2-reductase